MNTDLKVLCTRHILIKLIASATLLLSLSACFNNTNAKAKAKVPASTGTLTTSSASAQNTLRISQLQTITETGGPTLRVQFDVGGGKNFTQYCGSSGTCVCTFKWQDLNNTTSSTSSIAVSRRVETKVNLVQTGLAQCLLPVAYNTEIDNGTAITVGVKSAGSSLFASSEMILRKGNTVTTGASFTDDKGAGFWDVVRYTCFDRFSRATSITNKFLKIEATGSTTNAYAWVPLANQFCFQKMGASATSTEGCRNASGDWSNQSQYFSLYMRSSQIQATMASLNFFCANVTPKLSGPGDNVYPLDRNFSLASQRSADYPVGVEANSKFYGGEGDPSSYATGCTQDTSDTDNSSGGGGSSQPGGGIVRGCMGFAAKPDSAGACPMISRRNADGSIALPEPTYRLRRYFAVYPPFYDVDGTALEKKGQSVDTVYILDRPLMQGSTVVGSMLGPKPCPFAYLDHRGVAGAPYTPVATNSDSWRGRNTDGIELPYFDDDKTTNAANWRLEVPSYTYSPTGHPIGGGPTGASCAATAPRWDAGANRLSMSPVSSTNRYYIRPMQPWAPHYEEDASFQACAPKALTALEPPIHYYRAPGANDVRYCAEIYPTAVTAPSPNGIKRTTHGGPETERMVTVASSNSHWKVPLLAPAVDTENALRDDSAYACTITSDKRATPALIGKETPSTGCCLGQNLAAGAKGHVEPASGVSCGAVAVP